MAALAPLDTTTPRRGPTSPPSTRLESPVAPRRVTFTGAAARIAAAKSSSSSLSPPATPPSLARSNSARPHSRTPPLSAARHSRSLSLRPPSPLRVGGQGSGGMEEPPELARCSREVLVEMVVRHQNEVQELKGEKGLWEEQRDGLAQSSRVWEREAELARGRVDELMAEEARMEAELAGRIEVLDKLRSSVRELEREKREGEKRYREQGESFDSERQSWYDQEQHYKLRITNLSTSNRRTRLSDKPSKATINPAKESDTSDAESTTSHSIHRASSRRSSSPGTSPASVTRTSFSRSSTPSSNIGPTPAELALQDQLASLTTAHASLSTTSRALQVELQELKRVYQDLQEENESYEILLGEKTLNGQVTGSEFFRRNSLWTSPELGTATVENEENNDAKDNSGTGEEDSDDEDDEDDDREEESELDVEKVLLETQGMGSPESGAVAAGADKKAKRKVPAARKSGGLDLAAELEAAQFQDEVKPKKKSKKAAKAKKEKEEELLSEIKGLREANKALTLYVSKIVDRVCSQEGFEKVLAVDYRLATPKLNSNSPPVGTARPLATSTTTESRSSKSSDPPGAGDVRFATSIFSKSASLSASAPPSAGNPLGPRDRDSLASSQSSNLDKDDHANKRGFSGVWGPLSSSVSNALGFSRPSAPAHSASYHGPSSMKPFMLSASTSSETGVARKLDVEEEQEDEEDLRERERLRAEMALHGIQEPGNNLWPTKNSPSPSLGSDGRLLSASSTPVPSSHESNAPQSPLAIATEKFEKLDEQDRVARIEVEKGRASGFTEPKPRRHRPGSVSLRSSRSSSGSGSATPLGGLGLGIEHGREGRSASPSAVGSGMGVQGEQEGEGWSKKLKRLSISGWSGNSPPMA